MIDQALIEGFETDGAVVGRGVLDGGQIQSLRDAMPQMLEQTYDPSERMNDAGSKKVRTRDGIWRECEAFARFLFQSPVGEVAARFMRSDTARLYEDLLLYQEAGANGAAAWHRDAPHWPLAGHQLCSVWFSLEAVTSDTGAMKFVAGSHLDADELVNAGSIGVSESEFEPRRIITIEADTGDVVIFHPRALHTAYGSAPDRPRRTFTLRFMGDDVRWRPRRSMYHAWMRDWGLQKGDVLDHPWFPVVGRVGAQPG
jgi:ectoine hydroxylase-related dioxygenase (phytanoyl-CoA dioxygenase family)